MELQRPGFGLMKSSIFIKAPGPPPSCRSSNKTVVCWMTCSSIAEDDLPSDTMVSQYAGTNRDIKTRGCTHIVSQNLGLRQQQRGRWDREDEKPPLRSEDRGKP